MTQTETHGTAQPGTEQSGVRAAVHEAGDQAKGLAETGKEEVAKVAGELRTETSRMMDEARTTARGRAESQLGTWATMLGDMSGELDQMGRNARPDGMLAMLAHDGATAMRSLSERLQSGGMDGAMNDVRRFARQRPGAFLAGVFAIGIIAGRVTRNADLRNITSAAGSNGDSSMSGGANRSDDGSRTAAAQPGPSPVMGATGWTDAPSGTAQAMTPGLETGTGWDTPTGVPR